MADLLVTTHLDPEAWGPAKMLLRSAGSLDLSRATDLFGLVALGGDGECPAVAALREQDHSAELLALVVRSDRRGQGVGSRLLDGVADALRSGGCDRLWTTDHGAARHRWLTERGFEPVSHDRLELLL